MSGTLPAPAVGAATLRVIRVSVFDDHALVREALRLLLNTATGFEFCCGKATAEEGLACVSQHQPDLCVVDISMPGLSGIDAVRRILQMHASCRVLVLSMHDESQYAARAFRAGARGYVMKQAPMDHLLEAIRRVAAGEVYMSPAIQHAMLNGYLGGGGAAQPGPCALTDRELEVLRLIGQGYSTAQVGERLHRSPKTIDVHRQNLKHKLGLDSAADLVRYAIRWIESEDDVG